MSDNFGRIALSVVGLAAGAVFGAPTVGLALGSLVGQLAFGPGGPTQRGPRLGDLNVQSSAYGAPIPRVWGQYRLAGNVIWASDIQESEHKQSSKQGTAITYSYSASFAVGLTEGPIAGVKRIWADAVLIYNQSDTADVGTLIASGGLADSITLYPGDEAQLPDPTIEAHEGAGNVPAHRGLAYIVFENLQLAKFGNRIPNITAEVVSAGTPAHGTYAQFTDLSGYIDDGSLYGKQLFLAGIGGYDNGIVNVAYRLENTYRGVLSAFKQVDYRPTGLVAAQRFIAADNAVIVRHAGPWDGDYIAASDYHGLDPDVPYPEFVWHLGGALFELPPRVWSRNLLHKALYTGSSLYLSTVDEGNYPDYYYLTEYKWTPELVGPLAMIAEIASTSDITCVQDLAHPDAVWVRMVDPETIVPGYGGDQRYYYYPAGLTSQPEKYHLPAPDIGPLAFNGDTAAGVFSGYNKRLYVYDIQRPDPEDPDSIGAFLLSANPSDTFPVNNALPGFAPPMFVSDSAIAYGDGLIPIMPTLAADTVTLAEVVTDLCAEAGLAAVDTAALTAMVDGYVRTGPMSARAALEPLLQAYFLTAAESDDTYVFRPKDAEPVAVISSADLGAYSGGGAPGALLPATRAEELELPRRIQVQYANAAANYEQGQQYSARLITRAVNTQTVALPLVLTDDHAIRIADALLYDAWAARTSFTLALTPRYAALDPGDVISVATPEAAYTLLLTEVDSAAPGVVSAQAVAADASVYRSALVGGAVTTQPPSIGATGPTRIVALDAALARDQDEGAGFYVAGAGMLPGWSGGALYESRDAGQSCTQVARIAASAAIGSLGAAAAAAGPSTLWDEATVLAVTLESGTLASTSDMAVLNGANAAAVGAPGRWEILQFASAALQSDGSYVLSRLLRGRRGTEAFMAHAVGDRFVLLTPVTAQRIPANLSDRGQPLSLKGVSAGNTLSQADSQAFTSEDVGLMPYAPCHVRATRTAGGDLEIAWIRRTRIGGSWRDHAGVLLGEASEQYAVDILDGESVVRTLTAASPMVTYLAADEQADFAGSANPIGIRIYQISESVGRGYPADATAQRAA